MDSLQLRFILFIFFCIGSRTFFTILSAYSHGIFLQLLGILALFPVFGWIYIIFFGKRDTGAEVFGGKIWWQKLRPIHMFLWLLFAFLAISKNTNAWIALAADTTFGLIAFLQHHYSEGNLKKMISF